MKKILILATGGTIAGKAKAHTKDLAYEAGVFKIEELIKDLVKILPCQIFTEQVANIDSTNMSDEILLKLTKRLYALANDFDGFVITHGTDTLEESAYFLSLCVNLNKAVVLTGAMKPFNALSSDGLKNLYSSILLASSEKIKDVVVCMNDRIFNPKFVSKISSFDVNAFSSLDGGDLGYILNDEIYLYETKIQRLNFNIKNIKALAKVAIVYSHLNEENALCSKAFFESGFSGLVIAANGSGNIHQNHKSVLEELIKKGLKVVVGSRVLNSKIILSKNDTKLGFISACNLSPQKARILLQFALSQTRDNEKIQEYFKLNLKH